MPFLKQMPCLPRRAIDLFADGLGAPDHVRGFMGGLIAKHRVTHRSLIARKSGQIDSG